MSEGFIRQRRNLMLLSMFLLIYDFANIQIAKVSLLGTELIAGRPQVLEWVIWGIWAYLSVRYAQYFAAEEQKRVLSEFMRERRELIERKARERFSESVRGSFQVVTGGTGRAINLRGWSAEAVTTLREGYHHTQKRSADKWEVPCSTALGVSLKAVYKTSLHTTAVTDLLLPVGLSIAVALVALFELVSSYY